MKLLALYSKTLFYRNVKAFLKILRINYPMIYMVEILIKMEMKPITIIRIQTSVRRENPPMPGRMTAATQIVTTGLVQKNGE